MLGVMTDDALSQQPWTRPHVILLAARTLLLLRLCTRAVSMSIAFVRFWVRV